MTQRLRVGVAGLGFGSAVHVPGCAAAGAEVVALLGQRPDHACTVAAQTGLPVETDLEAWLDHDFDAVTVALPPNAVFQTVCAAIDRGVPILCEKPLGKSYAEAAELEQRAAGMTTAVDFQFSELEPFLRLKEHISGGALGTIRQASVMWQTCSWGHHHAQWSWKMDASRGGGTLALLGTHLFYLAEWLFGAATSVSARTESKACAALAPAGATPADDSVTLELGHRGGTVLTATIGNANPGPSVHRWTVTGERGTAVLENLTQDYMSGFSLCIVDRQSSTLSFLTYPANGEDGRLSPFTRLATRFIEAVRERRPCTPNFMHGARVALLTDAARASACRYDPISV